MKRLKDVKHARTGPTGKMSADPFQGSGNHAKFLIRQLDNVRTAVVGNVMKHLMTTQVNYIPYLIQPTKLSIIFIRYFVNVFIRMKFSLDALPYERLEDGEETTQGIDKPVRNLSTNELIDGSPIMNINNIKLHLNLSKPLEKIRNQLAALQNEKQGSFQRI